MHLGMVVLHTRRATRLLLFLLLSPGATAASAAAPGACSAALAQACGALSGANATTACDRCVLRNVNPLTKKGCSTPEAASFCSNTAKPPPKATPKCQAALEKACATAQPKGNEVCIAVCRTRSHSGAA